MFIQNQEGEKMIKKFIESESFTKRWFSMGLTDDDFLELQNYIMKNPSAGDIIQGTGGAIKLRWKLPHTGKSGGIRVIYIDLIKAEHVYFVTCYQKPKKETLTDSEKANIKQIVKNIIQNERTGM
jgi:hypothetical protein